jgi:hypothetical protein
VFAGWLLVCCRSTRRRCGHAAGFTQLLLRLESLFSLVLIAETSFELSASLFPLLCVAGQGQHLNQPRSRLAGIDCAPPGKCACRSAESVLLPLCCCLCFTLLSLACPNVQWTVAKLESLQSAFFRICQDITLPQMTLRGEKSTMDGSPPAHKKQQAKTN